MWKINFLILFQELNTALDEALKDYELASNWLDGQQSVESKK